ncbi:RHS repeat-associated core domain-containing protein [Victivallis sp. Marseille-Q1083]|uniref:RHS repeat-associated core domain-containing protein n=1 Tax=Victivallis sp. Marseille-Q1083 TaxID=2717288 RepID=UPI00158E67C9|nr:RHS repeat-associated core domain-containing protein [Victivallis sp. Marseille-Q1083]
MHKSKIYTYDNTTATPTFQTGYLWGEDLSGSLQRAGGVGGLLAEKRGGQTYLPVYDGNGNIMSYLNASTKASVAEYVYDAFGRTVSSSGTEADNFTYRFSTKPMDGNGLYYYGYRYYDPQHGRWISRDPLEEEGGVNLYGFVQNNIINRFDILGLAGNSDVKWVENLQKYEGARRLNLTYELSPEGEEATPGNLPRGTVFAKGDLNIIINDIENILKDSYDPYCHCIESITITAHSGLEGSLNFGNAGTFSVQDARDYLDGKNMKLRVNSNAKIYKFLFLIKKYLCEDNSWIYFSQCNTGGGEDGAVLLEFLTEFFSGTNTVIYLDTRSVFWFIGRPYPRIGF